MFNNWVSNNNIGINKFRQIKTTISPLNNNILMEFI